MTTLENNRAVGEKVYNLIVRDRAHERTSEGLDSINLGEEYGCKNPLVHPGGPSILYKSVCYNSFKVIAHLEKDIDLAPHREENGNTLLFAYFERESQIKAPFEMIDFLINKGVDINALNNNKETALYYLFRIKNMINIWDFIDLLCKMKSLGASTDSVSVKGERAFASLVGTRYKKIYDLIWR